MNMSAVLAAVLLLSATGVASAADLTAADYRYLRGGYGIAADDPLVAAMSADERARLHDIIDDPTYRAYPAIRDGNVADYLFARHMQECAAWAQSHPGQAHAGRECPPAADPGVEPGKEIADRQCNACHLFGTAFAPSFFKLAAQGGVTARDLARSLDHGHEMSPIHLQGEEIRALVAYIESLK